MTDIKNLALTALCVVLIYFLGIRMRWWPDHMDITNMPPAPQPALGSSTLPSSTNTPAKPAAQPPAPATGSIQDLWTRVQVKCTGAANPDNYRAFIALYNAASPTEQQIVLDFFNFFDKLPAPGAHVTESEMQTYWKQWDALEATRGYTQAQKDSADNDFELTPLAEQYFKVEPGGTID